MTLGAEKGVEVTVESAVVDRVVDEADGLRRGRRDQRGVVNATVGVVAVDDRLRLDDVLSHGRRSDEAGSGHQERGRHDDGRTLLGVRHVNISPLGVELTVATVPAPHPGGQTCGRTFRSISP